MLKQFSIKCSLGHAFIQLQKYSISPQVSLEQYQMNIVVLKSTLLDIAPRTRNILHQEKTYPESFFTYLGCNKSNTSKVRF